MFSKHTTRSQQVQMCACPCACRCAQNAYATLTARSSHTQMVSLFEDEEFPARWNVLYNPSVAAAWMRPHELCSEPRLFCGGRCQFEVRTDLRADGWFTAACSAIADKPELLKQVVPEGQVLYGPKYDGSVTFRFWHLGEWMDVKIDDRLPVDGNGVPIYTCSKNDDEFWLPLLEKAFAKFHKTYRYVYDANETYLAEGLSKLTGYSLKTMEVSGTSPEYTFDYLQKQADDRTLLLCKARALSGLTGGAYAVTEVCRKSGERVGEELKVVRLRSPWGAREDLLHFGNDTLKMRHYEIKSTMGYTDETVGEYWMDVNDFCKYFSQVYIGVEKPLPSMDMNMVTQIRGVWSDRIDEGGHPHDIEKFAGNPQFLLIVLGEETGDASIPKENYSPMAGMETIVELMQEYSIRKRSWDYKISFYIFEVYTERRLTVEQLLQMNYIAGDTDCRNVHSVHCRVRLVPGRRYVIIPTTCTPGYAGHFLLRVFSRQQRVQLKELPY